MTFPRNHGWGGPGPRQWLLWNLVRTPLSKGKLCKKPERLQPINLSHGCLTTAETPDSSRAHRPSANTLAYSRLDPHKHFTVHGDTNKQSSKISKIMPMLLGLLPNRCVLSIQATIANVKLSSRCSRSVMHHLIEYLHVSECNPFPKMDLSECSPFGPV